MQPRALAMVRFREWFHFLVLPLAGLDPSRGVADNAWPGARGAAIAFCVLGFGYLLNAVSDVGVDVDARKNPLLERAPGSAVVAMTVALAVAGLGLALTGPTVGLVATAVSLASGTLYSVGPRLKALPVVGTLANATNFVPLLWVGATSPDPPLARALAPAFVGLLLQSQIIHEAADAEGDGRAGLRTTFLVVGRRGSAALLALFGACPGIGSPVGLAERACLVAIYVVAVPLALLFFAVDPPRAARLRTLHRWSGLALGAALFLHGTSGSGPPAHARHADELLDRDRRHGLAGGQGPQDAVDGDVVRTEVAAVARARRQRGVRLGETARGAAEALVAIATPHAGEAGGVGDA